MHEDNNYEADRVSAASFRRSLDYCGALWTAQKRFLESLDERLAAFQPLSLHPYIAYISYVHARLARDPEVRRYYERFMKVLKRRTRAFEGFGRSLFTCPTGLRFCGESPDSAELDQAISFPLEKNVLVTVPVGRRLISRGMRRCRG